MQVYNKRSVEEVLGTVVCCAASVYVNVAGFSGSPRFIGNKLFGIAYW